jgi:ribosomal protein S18 acetylase RimI-like enzyme
MEWTIRDASPGDIDGLALIGGATFLETFAGIIDGAAIIAHCQREHSVAAYKGLLDGGYRAWLAVAPPGDAPIGFMLLGPPHLPGAADDGSDLELKRIYVLSRFHGGGPGPALMQRAIDEATRLGARRLLLGVYRYNDRALRFYRRNGFAQIGERRFRVGDRECEDLVLAKPLNGD